MDLIGFLFIVIFGLATFYFYYLSKTSKSHKVKDASVIVLGFMSVFWLAIIFALFTLLI
jgi:hypothetical protein